MSLVTLLTVYVFSSTIVLPTLIVALAGAVRVNCAEPPSSTTIELVLTLTSPLVFAVTVHCLTVVIVTVVACVGVTVYVPSPLFVALETLSTLYPFVAVTVNVRELPLATAFIVPSTIVPLSTVAL